MISSRNPKAVGLYSGGLDSILATKLVTEQGIEVVALHFRVPFPAPARSASEELMKRLAELAGANFVPVDVSDDYLNFVKSPKFGYSRNVAPCIDCILYMLRKARELAQQIRADFIFTGEVVGQRKNSQNKRALKTIERVSGLEGRLLRPLSAKLLEPTIPELTGLVRRERLLEIKGRGRRRQVRLAHEFGIIEYPVPAGGCLLTDMNFAARVRDAMVYEQLVLSDLKFLGLGRLFRIESGSRVIAGRNKKENERLEALVGEDDVVCRPVDVMGPVVLLRSKKPTKKDKETAARICARYSDGKGKLAVKVDCGGKTMKAKPYSDEEIEPWRVKPPSKRKGESDAGVKAEGTEAAG